MKELINSEKTVEVAVLPLLRLDLQYFADEGDPVETFDEPVNEPIDEPVDNPVDEPVDPGEKIEEPADPQEPSFKDDPQNQAFAQIRREKEAYEQQIRSMDATISEMYGESHGIHTFEEYQQAVEAERQAEEQQRYRDAGLPDEVIEKLSKVDEVLQQAEAEKQNRMLLDNFDGLSKEYPDMVKSPEDIPPEVWKRWDDGQSGLSLTEAFELVNKQAIRENLQASTKQSTLNKINSKEHIRGNGGEVSGDIDITSVPAETMQIYRQMYAKDIKAGKLTDSDFVKHYKKSN